MANTHDAFISYSHQADGELATSIESGLERLAKPLLRLRAMDVFRDQTSLTASPALWPSIQEHLAGSKWFILLACPASAQSPWCAKEVTWWLENRGVDTLLIVLTDGELRWDPTASYVDWNATTALSRSVAGKVTQEPLYVDLRWARGSQDASHDPRFREEIVRIAAPIRGMARDELDSADRRQLVKNKALVRGLQGGLSLVALLALWAAAYATVQKRQAIADAVLARAQAHASQALLNARTTPQVALGSAIAATDLSALYPEPGVLESAVLWAMRADPPAMHPPPEADVALRQSIALSRLVAVFRVAEGVYAEQIDGTPETSIVVVRMSNHSITVFDAASESVVARREPGNERLTAAFLMQSGKHALIVNEKGGVAVWQFDSRSERISGSLPPDKKPAFAITPQRDVVVWRGKAGVSLLALSDGTVTQAKACPGMTSLHGAMSAAGSVLAIQNGSTRDAFELCDVMSGRIKGAIKTSTEGLVDVQLSPDGRYLATASANDETVRIWDLKAGAEREVLRGHNAVPMRLAFSADSQRLAVGVADGSISSWRLHEDVSRPNQQDEIFLATGADGSITYIQELMRGRRILTLHSTPVGQFLRLWAGSMDVDATPVGDYTEVHAATIDVNARRTWLVTAGGLSSNGFNEGHQLTSERRSARPVRSAGFTHDRSYAFAVDDEGRVETWSLANASRSQYRETGKPVIDAQPIGECCLLVLLHEDGELAIYDLASSDKTAEIVQLGGKIGSVRFGRRPDRIFFTRGDTAEIHISGRRTRLFKPQFGAPVRGSGFTADDRSVFAVSEYDARLVDATDATNDHALSGHAAAIRIGQVSPDGARVATGSDDWTARIWDVASGAQVAILRGHSREVTQLEFGRDGRFLATAGKDGTIRVWNTVGGDQLLRIDVAANARVRILAFENEYLLVSADNKINLYRCIACQQSAALVREARDRMKAGIPKEFGTPAVSFATK